MAARLRFLLILCALASTFVVASATAPGCGGSTTIYPCTNPMFGRKAHDGRPDECCFIDCCVGIDAEPEYLAHCRWWDAGTSSDTDEESDGGPPATCPGACIDAPPYGWSDPGLLWVGPAGTEIPACPAEAPVIGFEGFADLVVPPASCGLCMCDVPKGDCTLPSSFTASSADCAGSGVTTAFDAPASWDGTCTNGQAISSCGSAGCVRSLTAGTLAVQNESCNAFRAESLIQLPPATHQTAARACKRGSSIACADPMQTCAPVAAAPPGFRLCVHQSGDVACPGSFPDKHVFATGIDDGRGCSPCTCGSPIGGVCVGTLNVYTDDACTSDLLSVSIASTGPACFDIVVPNATLGSKTVDKVEYIPGACAASGGELIGEATPTGLSTFCCQT
jgi:hypothetical protein